MRRIALALLGGISLVVVAVGVIIASAPAARADAPPGSACLAAPIPGTGTVLYKVVATLPTAAPANANGVCVEVNGTTRSGQIYQNAAGCAPPSAPVNPTPNAWNSFVSVDWGSTSCVKPGDNVVVWFYGGFTPAPAVNSVAWNLIVDTPTPGPTATGTPAPTRTPYPGTGQIVQYVSVVGGVAELSGENGSLPASADSSSGSSPLFALIAGIGMAGLVVVAGSGWYVTRRRHS